MSGIKDVDPIYMDVVVQNEDDVDIDDDEGYCNKCLEISEFSVAATNRELVNLENAAVNIDNSNDVIIGPVTQFNVNGNVTVYQNKDGLPIGIERDQNISTDDGPRKNGFFKTQPTSDSCQKHEEEVGFTNRRKFTLKFYLSIISGLLLLAALSITLIVLLHDKSEAHFEGNTSIISSFGTVNLISKKYWNGREAKKTIPMKTPVDFVVIKHTGGGTCNDFISCAKKLQFLQSEDFTHERDDIYCSFVVGGDGNIYEGRNWDTKPEYLTNSIDIVLLGNFAVDDFTIPMIIATKALLEYGVKNNKLTKDYKLVNHNQTENTLSPGIKVIREVKTWPNYDKTIYLGTPLLASRSSKVT